MKNLIITICFLAVAVGQAQITMTDLRADELKYGESVITSLGDNMYRAEIVVVHENQRDAKAYLFNFKNNGGLPYGLGRIVGPYLEMHGTKMENKQFKANRIIKANADTSDRCKSLPIVFGEYRACWNGTYSDYYAQRENCELCDKEIIEFEYGVKNGWHNSFYVNGDTQSTMQYKKGQIVGEDRTYFENGQLNYKNIHNETGRIVEHFYYWENGKPRFIENTRGRRVEMVFGRDGNMMNYMAADSITISYWADGSKIISTQNQNTKIWEKEYFNPKGDLTKKDIFDPIVERSKDAFLQVVYKNGKILRVDTVPHPVTKFDREYNEEGKEQDNIDLYRYQLPYYGLNRVQVSKLLEPISEEVKVKRRDEGLHSLQIKVDEDGKAEYSWQGDAKWANGKLANEILNTLQNELTWVKGHTGFNNKRYDVSATFVMDLVVKCKK
jgi:antitoxin component YwqK of YwqJK toxin-antitoxin module